MKNKEYFTVAEYAKIKSITPQAVYKQLNNKDSKLLKYIVEVEEQKYIAKEALTEEELNQFINQFNKDDKPVEQQFFNFEQLFNNSFKPFLEAQQGEKDKVIESLFKQLEEKDRQIEALQNALNQSQMLQAADKKLLLENQKKRKGLLRLFSKSENNQ